MAGAAVAQSRVPLAVVLILGTEATNAGRVDALKEGLRELGHVQGRSYRLEIRWADNRLERLPASILLRADRVID